MQRNELSDQEAVRMAAGSVRNGWHHSIIFSPWFGLDLRFSGGQLWRNSVALCSREAILEMNDQEIYDLVTR